MGQLPAKCARAWRGDLSRPRWPPVVRAGNRIVRVRQRQISERQHALAAGTVEGSPDYRGWVSIFPEKLGRMAAIIRSWKLHRRVGDPGSAVLSLGSYPKKRICGLLRAGSKCGRQRL